MAVQWHLALKEKGIAKKVIGVGRNAASINRATELGIIDEGMPLEEAVKQSDFIYVSIPVDATIPVMKQVMDLNYRQTGGGGCRFNKICIM